jgi:hypothetical protein
MIESSDELSKKVQRIKWSHGNEEITIQGKNGVNRFAIKAGGSAARGTSPTTVHLDELREQHDLDSFASLRYSLLAAKNPMIMAYSSAGDQHSLVLNQLRDRGVAAAAGGNDNIAYYEEKGVEYFVKDPELFRNKRVVIAGGGDSALDWSVFLSNVASEVTLVHRRNEFRGALDSVEKVQELKKSGKINLMTPAEVVALADAVGPSPTELVAKTV